MTADLSAWRAAAEEAARLGAARLEEWRARFSVREKAHADLVTEGDDASQQAIRTFLATRFPKHGFLGEEDAGAKARAVRPEVPTWIVDPLDGTANYVHDVPAYCVSVGLLAGGELVAGAIYDPRQDEMFSAAAGHGATLNGRPIRVSSVRELRRALLATGFPPDPEAQERNIHYWRTFAYKAQALRRTGSTALNLAYVAAGRFDGHWAYDNWAWDIAAGVVIVREAGGVVTRADGSRLDPFRPDIVAANPETHRLMIEALGSAPYSG